MQKSIIILLTSLIITSLSFAGKPPAEKVDELNNVIELALDYGKEAEQAALSNPERRGPYLAEKLHQIIEDIKSPDADVAALRRVIEAGVDVNARNKRGDPALLRVMQKGHIGAMRLMLDAGAYFNVDELSGVELIATLAKNRMVVLALVMYGIPWATRSNLVCVLLAELCIQKILNKAELCVVNTPEDVEKLTRLLQSGVPPQNALLYATGRGQPRALQALLPYADVEMVQGAIRINHAVLLRPHSVEALAAHNQIKELLGARLSVLRPVHWYSGLVGQLFARLLPGRPQAAIDPGLNRLLEEYRGVGQTQRDALIRSAQREWLVHALVFVTAGAVTYYYLSGYVPEAS